jgi:glucose/arabinose dehydrogenase
VTRTALKLAAIGLGVVLITACGLGSDGGSRPVPTASPAGPGTCGPTASGTVPTTPPTTNDAFTLAPVGTLALTLEEVARVDSPVALAAHPVSGAMLVAAQGGIVFSITDCMLDPVPVLDLSGEVSDGNEQGLLGLAISPDGSRLYVDFTDRDGDTRIVEFALAANPPVADPATRREVLFVDQPFANHNGGQLAFGPDGYLYIALGDGGSQGDPDGNGQRLDTLLAKILRIDPATPAADGSLPYTVPSDNPFASGRAPDGSEARPEIWAYGLRNPWRFSFDRSTGDLWIGDVGGKVAEEIDVEPAGSGGGRNYGWSIAEGSSGVDDAPGAIAPLVSIDHADNDVCSVIGGYVYRGSAIRGLVGTYLSGDFCRPALYGLRSDPAGVLTEGPTELGLSVDRLTSFGEDLDGEIWLTSRQGGVYRLRPA